MDFNKELIDLDNEYKKLSEEIGKLKIQLSKKEEKKRHMETKLFQIKEALKYIKGKETDDSK